MEVTRATFDVIVGQCCANKKEARQARDQTIAVFAQTDSLPEA